MADTENRHSQTPLLDQIKTPADLRALPIKQLSQVADELRAETISAVSVTGGHLGAGLGVVETLTPAILHLYGVPFENGLAGLLVYRAIGTLFPAVVGTASLASLRLLKPPDETPEEKAQLRSA